MDGSVHLIGPDEATLRLNFNVQPANEEGDPEIGTRGVAQIRDVTSNSVLIAERTGSTATCSADPGTGTQMLDSMSLLFQDPQSGDIVELLVQPVDATAPIPGTFDVTMRSGEDVWMGEITIRQPGPPARGHDRR